MNCSNVRISLDIHKNYSGATVYAKKGDVGRRIYVTLTDGGVPYHIAEDCTAVFTAEKPDEHILFNDCTIHGDTIIYDMTEQTTAVAGRANCEIKLYGADGKLITSPSFTLIVADTVYDEGDEVESLDEFSALTALIADANAVIREGNETNAESKKVVAELDEHRQHLVDSIAKTEECSSDAKAAGEAAKKSASDAQDAMQRSEDAAREAADSAVLASSAVDAASMLSARAQNAAETATEAAERAVKAAESVGSGGGLSITDDGNGNVTITATGGIRITDDGNGNVTIA